MFGGGVPVVIKPICFLRSAVRHRRLVPRHNYFKYRTFYIALDLMQIDKVKSKWLFGINRRGLLSYQDKDHGQRDGRPALEWANNILATENLSDMSSIVLVSMPRVLGYAFNPVSFYLCYQNNLLCAVISEVNNTFGETHSYLCLPSKGETHISTYDWIIANKQFHVSPFFKREGFYKFRFKFDAQQSEFIIHYYINKQPVLITSVKSSHEPFTTFNSLKLFVVMPLMTLKVMLMIHYQAFKIMMKKIRYINKPIQYLKKLTKSNS